MIPVRGYDAVMFDWMLTLADYPDPREHLRRAHEVLDRLVSDHELDGLARRLRQAEHDVDVAAAGATEDCSPELHWSATRLLYERAAIDDVLADALYALLGDPSFHPVYPEVAPTLTAIAEAGIRIAVVSDIHVDLRVHGQLSGIDHLIDRWILSFEHGVQKPDAALFQLALDTLGTPAEATLMVGDRASHDGAASVLGIDTLILPSRSRPTDGSRFNSVLRLLLA